MHVQWVLELYLSSWCTDVHHNLRAMDLLGYKFFALCLFYLILINLMPKIVEKFYDIFEVILNWIKLFLSDWLGNGQTVQWFWLNKKFVIPWSATKKRINKPWCVEQFDIQYCTRWWLNDNNEKVTINAEFASSIFNTYTLPLASFFPFDLIFSFLFSSFFNRKCLCAVSLKALHAASAPIHTTSVRFA